MKDLDKSIIETYLSGKSLQETAILHGFKSLNSARNVLLKHKISIRSTAGLGDYTLRHDYFDEITTEAQAYFIGFILADGSISIRKNSQPCIRVEICRKDIKLLEKLKDEWKTANNVTLSTKDCCRIAVHSTNMVKSLSIFSIFPNKTLQKFFPIKAIPQELHNHFIRGFFDGNGWLTITSSHGRPNKRIALGFADGTEFLRGLKTYLEEILGLSIVSITHENETAPFITYSSKQQVITLLKFLYKDASIFLERKKQKADLILNAFVK